MNKFATNSYIYIRKHNHNITTTARKIIVILILAPKPNKCYTCYVMTLNNQISEETNMLKVTVKYQNTNIFRDANFGWDWLNERYNLDRNFIENNYSNVVVHNIPESHPWETNKGICEQLFHKYNHITTDELKNSKGFDAKYIQGTGLNSDEKGYIGHTSMSIGDIVTIMNTDTCETKVYYCDEVGFKDITEENIHYYSK